MQVPSEQEPATKLAARSRTTDARLSLPFVIRISLGITIASCTGMILGAAHGSQAAGFRFRAENAHRLPTTQTGWYLYHKSKNYHRMLGGVKDGIKMAGRLSGWTFLFVGMEEAIDRARLALTRMRKGDEAALYVSKDLFSTSLAGLGTAGAFSAWHRFPVPTAARLARLGLKAGLAYGILQDLTSLLRGRRLGYVEFVKRRAFGHEDSSESLSDTAG
ncbi:hypothetical protein AMS68_005010 [Peltaster fructicola]|uniref:Uncharacterized protein n=1 Tax=Peltaster fructicola TaxID=286661 RepID=A0A6H0XXL3_9PEZI|nr:hypothetical protein AMS68_005010 [Peltaster fructicola]